MKKTVTYAHLEKLANDISEQMEKSPAFHLFNYEKINRFFDKNKLRLQSAMEKRRELVRKYVKHDAHGPMTTEKDGIQVFVFEAPDLEQEFNKEYNEFFNRQFDLNF